MRPWTSLCSGCYSISTDERGSSSASVRGCCPRWSAMTLYSRGERNPVTEIDAYSYNFPKSAFANSMKYCDSCCTTLSR